MDLLIAIWYSVKCMNNVFFETDQSMITMFEVEEGNQRSAVRKHVEEEQSKFVSVEEEWYRNYKNSLICGDEVIKGRRRGGNYTMFCSKEDTFHEQNTEGLIDFILINST